MRLFLLLIICFTCSIAKASTLPIIDDTCKKSIHVNYPIVNLTDLDDTVLVRLITFNTYYDSKDDLFVSLDSISNTIYCNENVGIKMLYNRYFDVNGEEFLVISKVRITSRKKTVIKIRIKKSKKLGQKYYPSSSVLIKEKITFLHLFRIRIG